jgi:CII-binding regulator of phage lambda lysogenization HflD
MALKSDTENREILLDSQNFEQIEQKLRTVNPTLFCKAFLDVKIFERSYWKFLKKMWKKSKGHAVAVVLLTPFVLFQVRKSEKVLRKYEKIFIESNEKLKKMVPKAKKESEKRFLTTFIELNSIAIKMNPLILEEIQRTSEIEKMKKIFTQNPTTENLLGLWNIMKDLLVLNAKLAKLQKEKADIQDKVIEYEREMTKFDKKDIQDFWRAILVDFAFSYIEQRILVVNTPIEILLKSGRIVNKIRKAFFMSGLLRESANLREESIDELMNWLISYQEEKV